MSDLSAVIWKELREELVESITPFVERKLLHIFYTPVGRVAVVIFVSILVGAGSSGGARLTAEFFITVFFPFLYASQVVTNAIAGERERGTLETLLATPLTDGSIFFGKVAVGIIMGSVVCASSFLILIATAYLINPASFLSAYLWPLFFGVPLSGLLASSMGAGLAAIVSVRATSAKQANQVVTAVPLVLVVIAGFWFNKMPIHQRAHIINLLSSIGVGRVMLVALGFEAVFSVLTLIMGRANFTRRRMLQ